MHSCPELGQLESLHAMLPEAAIQGAGDIGLSGCACDSRKVKPGDLFVAIRGEKFDGLNFVAEAVDRGCAGVLSDRPIDDYRIPTALVPNARAAYGELSQHLAGNPSRLLKVIGVTGSNGKTTTACLIAGILSHAGRKTGLIGTLGYFDGDDVEDPTHTTPPPEKLAELLARMVRNGCSHAVMEVSRHALAQSRIAGISYDAACVTNVTPDHLDSPPSIQNYRRTKKKLFAHLSGEGFAVVNADDPVASGFLKSFDGPALTIGIENAAEIMGTPIEQCASEQTFLITAGSETLPVRTQMIGTHHIYNCLTAAAVGLTYGLELPRIVRSLEAAAHVPGRLERIECGQPFSVFVDFAHTPDALKKALQTLRAVTAGRVICVFGAGGERDRTKRPLMGRIAEQYSDLAIVTSDNPRREDQMSIMIGILKGFSNVERAEIIPDRGEAIRHALAAARPDDCVLIAGKGHERFQIIGDEQFDFDDREVAKRWLYQLEG
ncbi:MAG: UDP-N-acetylmuramoyl-L-alanyl-D-glutamate--2,6-diaminopimelate ligase [Pirellulales bacterium]|nr:UDP-N-acetylmuramoyl-L-alanyl-D-glutamate--2,6-diaminopimelate ligase [Pirellulales bacterium]